MKKRLLLLLIPLLADYISPRPRALRGYQCPGVDLSQDVTLL